MVELRCEYLPVRCIWLYVIIMSHTSFRVNPHSVICLNIKELLAEIRRHMIVQVTIQVEVVWLNC